MLHANPEPMDTYEEQDESPFFIKNPLNPLGELECSDADMKTELSVSASSDDKFVALIQKIAKRKNLSECEQEIKEYFSTLENPPENLSMTLNSPKEKTEMMMYFAEKLQHSWITSQISTLKKLLNSRPSKFSIDRFIRNAYGDKPIPTEIEIIIEEFENNRKPSAKKKLPEGWEVAGLFIADQADKEFPPCSTQTISATAPSKKRSRQKAGLPQAKFAADSSEADSDNDSKSSPPKKIKQKTKTINQISVTVDEMQSQAEEFEQSQSAILKMLSSVQPNLQETEQLKSLVSSQQQEIQGLNLQLKAQEKYYSELLKLVLSVTPSAATPSTAGLFAARTQQEFEVFVQQSLGINLSS